MRGLEPKGSQDLAILRLPPLTKKEKHYFSYQRSIIPMGA